RLVASVLDSVARAKREPVFIHEVPQSQPLASEGLKTTCPIPASEFAAEEKSLAASSMRTEATAYSAGLRTHVLSGCSAKKSSWRKIARTTSRIERPEDAYTDWSSSTR